MAWLRVRHAPSLLHLHQAHVCGAWRRAAVRSCRVCPLQELYPKLVAWMDFLYRERDADGDGLVYIRHP